VTPAFSFLFQICFFPKLFPIFPFFEVGNLSWSAARIPPKRTSSDRSKSAPKYHDEFRFALRLVRNFNLKAVISIARPLRPIAILCGLVSLNHCSALVVCEVNADEVNADEVNAVGGGGGGGMGGCLKHQFHSINWKNPSSTT
jgi:hypothetical protein